MGAYPLRLVLQPCGGFTAGQRSSRGVIYTPTIKLMLYAPSSSSISIFCSFHVTMLLNMGNGERVRSNYCVSLERRVIALDSRQSSEERRGRHNEGGKLCVANEILVRVNRCLSTRCVSDLISFSVMPIQTLA